MNLLPAFDYQSQKVRVLEKDGSPWFVAKDVCEIVGISNSRQAMARLEEDEKSVSLIDTPGGAQNLTTISESGLYSLIIRSDKPEAKPFRKWVTSEVLPQIRKTGQYSSTGMVDLRDPETLLPLLGDYAERLKIAQQQLSDVQPKLEAFDRLDTSEGGLSLRPASKVLGYPERKLSKFLEVNGWAFRQSGKGPLQAYSQRRKDGFLDHKLRYFNDPRTGEDKVEATLVITPKGLSRLSKILPSETGQA